MTPERKAQLRAVCEWFRPQTLPDESLDHALRYGLPEALDEIERLEREADALRRAARSDEAEMARLVGKTTDRDARIADLERRLADTRRDVRDLQAELNRRP